MQNVIQTLTVALDERSYPIHIGCGILAGADLLLPHLKQGKVAIVSKIVENLASLVGIEVDLFTVNCLRTS